MKVICAGMPKTGTTSLATALRILGYNVHDYMEQLYFHMDEYTQALEGKELPNFRNMYEDVDSVTDNPACYYFKEIFQSFPESKVILSLREDDGVWYESYMRTYATWLSAASKVWVILAFALTPTGRRWERFNAAIIKYKLKYYDRQLLTQTYNDHNISVKAVIPKDQLLVYNVKEGWEPLCRFLGVDVPNIPFPRVNVKSGAIKGLIDDSVMGRQMFKELVFLFIIFTILLAVIIVLLV